MAVSMFSPPRVDRSADAWETRSLRSLLTPRSERDRPDLPLLTVARERGVFVRSDEDANHNAIPNDLGNYKVARSGDLVINKMKAWQGSLGLAPVDGIVSPAYFVFEADFEVPRFGEYLLRSKPYVARFGAASDGVRIGQWDLDISRMRNIEVSLPRADEQAAIAKYLAHANARIDKAISAKRHLIALVEEQKRSLLNERMLSVPSGDLVPVKALLRPVSSVVGDSHRQKTLLSLTLRGVVPRDLENAKGKFPSDFSTYQDVRPGQFVFCLFDVDETPRTVGLSRVEGMITGAYDVFDSVDPSASEYLELFFTAMDNVKGYRPLYTGLRKVLPMDRFLRTVVPFPSEDVRQSVVGEIRASMTESTAVIERVSREIALLQEFRTRLVADVVTGQVDVRAIAESLPDTLEQDTELDSLLDDDLEDVLGGSEE